ncbi:DUF1353 domain-containing protein [Azotobacter beijerinckii]|uniref:DUF1353 domain-containing protein n=1 Tax=Azotobacter beijerinckii TaxID=170623 RepID=UPI0029539EAC|nr:DUF1353 domain-containing protein [Azotobacter beijerinckii]MDV7209879.1 DUF1353 domain-containing protein [Azotobacter beijerinckii]
MNTGFSGPLDLRAHRPDEWLLLTAITYTPRAGRSITVPAGFITDLASIPALLRPIFDSNDESRQPAVLHDWLYCRKETTREEADGLFREALERAGVGFVRRWAMYAGVRAGGWLYWGRRDGLGPEDFVGD